MRFCLLLICFVVPALISPPAAGSSVNLPTLASSQDLLQSRLNRSQAGMQLHVGATAYGTNNVGNLWALSDDDQLPRVLGHDSGYATMATSERLAVSLGEWWVEYGSGRYTWCRGDSDAAQLWIDLHSDSQTQEIYSPTAEMERMDLNWYGVGRSFPIQAGDVRGTVSMLFRRVDVDEFRGRSITGTVRGEDFGGMMKTITSTTSNGRVEGSGWAVDARAVGHYGRAHASVSVEGMLGEVSWKNMYVEDSNITSSRVFEDAEGFLAVTGGISGTGWLQDFSASVNPHFRLDILYEGKVDLLASLERRKGEKSAPSLGAAWPREKWGIPYFRYYPNQPRLEIGAVGRGWQFRISGDDWIGASPKHGEASLTVSPLSF